jgi:hypothetical protein
VNRDVSSGKIIPQAKSKPYQAGPRSTLAFSKAFHRADGSAYSRRRMGRQENVRADHTALAGVVAVLAVILARQSLPGSVGSRSESGLSSASLSLRDAQTQ